MNEDATRMLYPVQEAAAALGVQRTTIYRLIQDGEVERVKIGRRSLITAESVRGYVERLTAKAKVGALQ